MTNQVQNKQRWNFEEKKSFLNSLHAYFACDDFDGSFRGIIRKGKLVKHISSRDETQIRSHMQKLCENGLIRTYGSRKSREPIGKLCIKGRYIPVLGYIDKHKYKGKNLLAKYRKYL